MFRRQALSVALFAAATLCLESTFTRLLAVAQFYHFAFLVVSLALLGFAVSGTILSLFPRLDLDSLNRFLVWLGVGFFFSVGVAYACVNLLPFDSYRIAWERRQILFFCLYYLSLAIPFLVSGLGIGAALAVIEKNHHLLYAANLFGSAIGAFLAPLALRLGGVPGTVLLSACLGLLPALILEGKGELGHLVRKGGLSLFVIGLLAFGVLGCLNAKGQAPLGMKISQYKGLSQAFRYPGSKSLYSKWNSTSRVDVLSGAGTRRLPGLSYAYEQNPPPQHGLSVDAGPLHPLTLTSPVDFEAAAWMPESLAFLLNPEARVLVVEPGGGLGVLQALAGDAVQVTAVVENSLLLEAAENTIPTLNIYQRPRVDVVSEPSRVFLSRNQYSYDICFFPLTDAYRPVTSGAYSLAENYTLTVEGLASALDNLSPNGILVISRWMQSPPSESLRLVAILVEAMTQQAVEQPEESLVIYRGIQTLTVLVRPHGWTHEELGTAREFLETRRFDLVWAPGIREEEPNRFNRLPEPVYYQNVKALLVASNREAVYDSYPYDISPPKDDHPFFFHFFTWEQTPEILSTLGKTWQPFGGSGYFILLALLALVVLLSLFLVLSPMILLRRGSPLQEVKAGKGILVYFSLLGLGFLFLEIPLIQRWILLLGQPTYAFTVVVLALLFFSGLGSMSTGARWQKPGFIFGILVLVALGYTLAMPYLMSRLLSWPLWARVVGALFGLAPLGFLMGLPFPMGLAWLKTRAPRLIPWVWAINGCASVVASVLAAILALSYGYTFVMFVGTVAYAIGGIVFHCSQSKG